MRAERMAFEAWLIIQAMRRAFTDEQVTDLRMAFGAGWAARSDTEEKGEGGSHRAASAQSIHAGAPSV